MKQIRVRIEGTAPLLMNQFIEVPDGPKPNNPQKGTPYKQAEVKVYKDSEGKPMIPGANIYSGLIHAGHFQKLGKSKLTTQKSSLIPAGIFLTDIECLVTPTNWCVDTRPVVIPATGGRVICHRPRFDEWGLRFNLEYDETMFSEVMVRQLVEDMGSKIGLGDFRPQRKGPFGRFKVTEWFTGQ